MARICNKNPKLTRCHVKIKGRCVKLQDVVRAFVCVHAQDSQREEHLQTLKQLHWVTMRYCLPFTPTRKGHLPFSLPKTNQEFLEGRLKSLKIFCLWLLALHPSWSHTCRKRCRFTACTHMSAYTPSCYFTRHLVIYTTSCHLYTSCKLGVFVTNGVTYYSVPEHHNTVSFAQVLDTVPATTCRGVVKCSGKTLWLLPFVHTHKSTKTV